MSKRIDPRVIEVYGRLWRYVIPYRLLGFIAVIGMVASSLVEGLLVWMLEPMTDEALVAHNLETAKWLPVAFVGVFIVRGLAGFATESSLGWIGRGVISALRRDVFKKFLTLPSRFIEQNSTGPLLSRMTYNVEMISESVTHVVTTLIRDVLTILAAAAVMLYQSPRLTVLVAIVLPLIALLIRALAKAFRRYSSRIQDSVGEVTQVTEEVLSGHRVVKIFGGYAYETERMFNADERNRKQHLKLVQARSLGTALTQVIFGLSVALVIYFAGVESMENKLSPGKFISFFSAMMLMLQPLRRLTNLNAVIQRGIAAGDSLFRIMDEPDEVDSGTVERDKVRGDVEFRNVRFSYGNNGAQVIDNLSLSVAAGRSLAIVGHSGSVWAIEVAVQGGRRAGNAQIDGNDAALPPAPDLAQPLVAGVEVGDCRHGVDAAPPPLHLEPRAADTFQAGGTAEVDEDGHGRTFKVASREPRTRAVVHEF